MRRFSGHGFWLVLACIFVPMGGGALAGSFAVREQSAAGQGMSFAGVAAGSAGISSMFWNPATVTMRPGFVVETDAAFIAPYAKLEPDALTLATVARLGGVPAGSGDVGQLSFVPSSYGSYQLSDAVYVGLSVNSPFGLVSKPDQNWAGQIYGRSSRLMSVNATPTLGVRLSDWLAVGAGLQLQYIDVRLKQAVALAPGAPSAILDGDDWGVGFTLGALLTPWSGTELGVGFRSAIHYDLEGTLAARPGLVLPVEASLMLPETVTLGLTQRLTEQWRLTAGAEWTNWSRLQSVAVINTLNGQPATSLGFRYDDGWFFSLGAEYDWNPNLTLRAGLGYELSPIGNAVRTVRIPDADRIWASIGATWRVSNRLAFDIGYSHIFVEDAPVRIVPGHPDFKGLRFVADSSPSLDIVSIALRYRWDEPAEPSPALVRKY